MALWSGRSFLFLSALTVATLALAGCSGGGSSQASVSPQAPQGPTGLSPLGLPYWPDNDPNTPPREDLRVTLANAQPGPLPLVNMNGQFPTFDFASGKSPASTAGPNDYEYAGVTISNGGSYNGIYAEHTAYVAANFAMTYNHGGDSVFAPYDAIEAPLERVNNGGCIAAGTFTGSNGTQHGPFFTALSWCGLAFGANASLGAVLFIDATFVNAYVGTNSHGLPTYHTQVFTTDSSITASSVWHIQLQRVAGGTWDEYASGIFPTAANRTGLMTSAYGYSGYLAAHQSGQCPGGLPVQAADNVQLHFGAGTPGAPGGAGWSVLAPSMTGITTTAVAPASYMACFQNDVNNPGTTGAATNAFAVVNSNNYWHVTTIAAPAQSCADIANIYGYYPCDLTSAYNLPAPSGTGTIAIVDAFDDPNAEADLQVYRSQFGLPTCTTANGCFKKLDQTGGTTYPAANASWAGEIALDLDMASAVCPNCKIILLEANDNSTLNLATAVQTASGLAGVRAISNSYGGLEGASSAAAFDTLYDHTGIAVVASSGDNAFAAGPQYPAASVKVIAAGGTALYRDGSARGWTEKAWGTSPTSGAGSGCSQYSSKPTWQLDGGCAKRMIADVSAVADPNTGVAVYNTYGGAGGWQVIGGTSASSPIIAAIYASDNTGTITHYAKSIYDGAGGPHLNDIVSGTNGPCGGSPAYYCNGVYGYDGPTGNGSPADGCTFIEGPHTCGGGGGASIGRVPQTIAPAGEMRRVTSGPSAPLCGPVAPGYARCFAWRRTDIGNGAIPQGVRH